ncbi:MAG: hypothetical protein HKN82_06760 [Akkermansiaceae bacterium]|nr:hypothetical protein [Akkermansiaceae bacterium]
MNKTADPPQPASTSRGNSGNDDEAACATHATVACTTCNLYKWYPPLLLLSTIMAGVFCCLYLTKPVFLAPSGDGYPGAVSPAVETMPSPLEEDDLEPKTAQIPARMNPEMGALPGESRAEPPAVAGLQPLITTPRPQGLFRPLAPAAAPDPEDTPEPLIVMGGESEPIRIQRTAPIQPMRIVRRIPDPVEERTPQPEPADQPEPAAPSGEPVVAGPPAESGPPPAGEGEEASLAASTFDRAPLLTGPILSPESADSSATPGPVADAGPPTGSDRPVDVAGPPETPAAPESQYEIAASFMSEFASRPEEVASIDRDDPQFTAIP